MDILLASAFIAVLVEFGKWLSCHINNKELTKAIIIGLTSALALTAALIYQHTPQEVIEAWVQTWLTAAGFYNVGYKFILKPALEKLGLV